MLDTMRKVLLAGVGTMDLTEEKLHAVLRDLIARGDFTEQEALELTEHWRRGLASQQEELQYAAREAVQRALRSFDVPTRQDFEALTRRVEAVERAARPPLQGLPEADMDAEC